MKKVLLIIVGVIVVALLGTLLLPSKVRVERSIVINAPAAKIFPEVNSFQKWGCMGSLEKERPEYSKQLYRTGRGSGKQEYLDKQSQRGR
jgi:hypothetical protein